MKINSLTKVYCIFGSPVKHSLSPLMHNALFNSKNINSVYIAFEPSTIEKGIEAMRTLNIQGASVTIPFKVDVMKYLDYCDPLAKSIGSVNTLYMNNGKLEGYNTDGIGAVRSLVTQGINIQKQKICVLGNGGSARAIAFTLLSHGAHVTIAGRNKEKIARLVQDLSTAGPVNSDEINKLSPINTKEFDTFINTTPVGMHPHEDESPLKSNLLHNHQTIFDIIYAPLQTRLLREAKDLGCKTINGLDMLVYQGAEQFELWTKIKADIEIMQSTITDHLKL